MPEFLENVVATAHGKVNLYLQVGDLRPDGYHDLTTVYESLSLSDELSLTAVGAGGGVRGLSIQGPRTVPTDQTNLAWKAVELLVAAYRDRGFTEFPEVEISIRKGIPVAGGMAGGSADAAAALCAMERMLAPAYGPIGRNEMLRLAATLGSDVPFALIGGVQLGTGRGEQLTSVMHRGTHHWVLAMNSKGLSTPTVFQKLDQLRQERTMPRIGQDHELPIGPITADPQRLAQALANDLQPAALSLLPELRRTLAAGKAAGALAGIVSGSGPTCAFICADMEHAHQVADALIDDGVASAVTTAFGPADGVVIQGQTWQTWST